MQSQNLKINSAFSTYILSSQGKEVYSKGNVIDGDTYFITVEALVSDYLGKFENSGRN